MVYTRTVNGSELDFGVSGKLYKDALVMFDRQTQSLWTQVDGSVLRGALQGARLQPVPAVQTTWAEWKRLHPDTLVLKKNREVQDTRYADYHSDPRQMGIADTQNPDSRLPGKSLVVTVRRGEDALAIPLKALKRRFLHQTTVDGQPLALVFNRQGKTVRAFDRRVHGRTLSFTPLRHGKHLLLRDQETATLWSGLTGKALEGELAGQQLPPVAHMVNYWFAWVAYNPQTRLEP